MSTQGTVRPFFIVGCPRSGTTVLQLVLNRHSEIAIPPETKYFYYFHRMPRLLKRSLLHRIERDLNITLPEELLSPSMSSRDVYEHIITSYLSECQFDRVRWVGDKTPEQTTRIAEIRSVFPAAPIFFIYRDGRAVAHSLRTVPWIRCDLLSGMQVWLRFHSEFRYWKCANDPNMYFVKYEKMVSQPESVFNFILTRLGLRMQPGMIEGEGDPRHAVPNRELTWKRNALRPLTGEYIDAWKLKVSSQEMRNLESLGGEALYELGYLERPPDRASPLLRMRSYASVLRMLAGMPARWWFSETWSVLNRLRIISQYVPEAKNASRVHTHGSFMSQHFM